MNTATRSPFLIHDLGEACEFEVGRLPDELVWSGQIFDEVWLLHPRDRHQILMHGRPVQTPLWQQAYGADYHYCRRINKALAVPNLLTPLLDWVREEIFPELNGIILNWYEGPCHYMAPHRDSITNMIKGAPIVTISFGETRVFRLTKGTGDARVVRNFPAPNGTIFVMPFSTNLAWKHGVPKSTRYIGRRISVTIRAFEKGLE